MTVQQFFDIISPSKFNNYFDYGLEVEYEGKRKIIEIYGETKKKSKLTTVEPPHLPDVVPNENIQTLKVLNLRNIIQDLFQHL
jgi:hypothetical protein